MDSQILAVLEYTKPNATPHSSHTTVENNPSGRSVRKQLIKLGPMFDTVVFVEEEVEDDVEENVNEEEEEDVVVVVVVVAVAGAHNPIDLVKSRETPILSS